jgi:AcrR family transcriptional regulator
MSSPAPRAPGESPPSVRLAVDPEDSPAAPPESAANSPRPPRRARGVLRVEALLSSAAEVFAQKGFDAATMTEIAAQADSSIGSLYQFFLNKEAVAEALVRTQVDALWVRFDGLAERAPAMSTPALGQALARFLLDFRAAHPSFATLVERPGNPSPLIAGVRRKVRERVEDILVRHAPEADRSTLRAMAPVVQHTMKSAVQIQAELDGAESRNATRELEAMLVGYLAMRLGDSADQPLGRLRDR